MHISIFLATLFYFSIFLFLFTSVFHKLIVGLLFDNDYDNTGNYGYIDFFRGISALLILLMHYYEWTMPTLSYLGPSGLVANGQKAVGVFFFLSAYLLWNSIQKYNLWIYFFHRLFRIYPLHILITFYLFYKVGFPLDNQLQEYIDEGILINVFTNKIPKFNPISWSIVIELQFYIFLPILIFMFNYHRFSFALFMVVVLFISIYVENSELYIPQTMWQLTWIKFFISGIYFRILMNKILSYKDLYPKKFAIILMLIGVIGVVSDFYDTNITYYLTGKTHVMTIDLCIFLVILFTGIILNENRAKIFSWLPFRYCGLISYSLYLTQFIIMGEIAPWTFFNYENSNIFLYFIIIPSHLFIATLLFCLVEKPFMQISKSIGSH